MFALVSGTLLLFLSGFLLGGYAKEVKYKQYFNGVFTKRITDDPYSLVSPLVGTESPSALEVGRFEDVNQKVLSYAELNSDDISSYSLYYRDLNSSQWFGINENEAYVPASLLKLAIAIAFLKQEEEDPSFRAGPKIYTQRIADINTSLPNLDPSELVVGKTYDTEYLLRKMLVDSDNGAKNFLFDMLDKKYFYSLFKLLNINEPEDALNYKLSSKDYALFIRILYNGSYLQASDSQKVLKIMSNSKFTSALVAGVPEGVIVAHKYGTYILSDSYGNKEGVELHDCGIIYGEHPYILCIMTKGKETDQLAAFIAGLSKIIYESVQEAF